MVARWVEACVDPAGVAEGIAGKISEREDGSANEEEREHRESLDGTVMFV